MLDRNIEQALNLRLHPKAGVLFNNKADSGAL